MIADALNAEGFAPEVLHAFEEVLKVMGAMYGRLDTLEDTAKDALNREAGLEGRLDALEAKADHIPDPTKKVEDHVADTGIKVVEKGDWVRATARHGSWCINYALSEIYDVRPKQVKPYCIRVVSSDRLWRCSADELTPWTPEPGETVVVKLKGGTVLVGTWDNRSNNDIVWLESVGVDSSRAVYVFKSRILSIEPWVEDGK